MGVAEEEAEEEEGREEGREEGGGEVNVIKPGRKSIDGAVDLRDSVSDTTDDARGGEMVAGTSPAADGFCSHNAADPRPDSVQRGGGVPRNGHSERNRGGPITPVSPMGIHRLVSAGSPPRSHKKVSCMTGKPSK